MQNLLKHAELGQQNKERLRQLYEAINAGKHLKPADIFDNELVVFEPVMLPYGGRYEGVSGQVDLGKAQEKYMNRAPVEVLALFADGENVISNILIGVTGTDKKLMMSEQVTYKAGKMIEVRVFVHDQPGAAVAELFKSQQNA